MFYCSSCLFAGAAAQLCAVLNDLVITKVYAFSVLATRCVLSLAPTMILADRHAVNARQSNSAALNRGDTDFQFRSHTSRTSANIPLTAMVDAPRDPCVLCRATLH